ncbi:hypothetical protein LguiB_014303 [Lonicera macranthoides]
MKSDVYSFGVVLFEVLCGRRAVDFTLDEEQWSLARWAQCCIEKGTLHRTINPNLWLEILPESLKEFVRIANQCLCYRPKKRPTMTQVVNSLELALALQLGHKDSSAFEMEIIFTTEADEIIENGDPTMVQEERQSFMFSTAESKSTNDMNNKDQPVAPILSSSNTSNGESTPSTPNVGEELKISSQLRKFSFRELKAATRNFGPESFLGEGGFGYVYKGWINENGITPVKPGMGLTVAVKILNHDGLQGHKEWLHVLCAGSLPLPWSIRMKIALGAAKGLAFLHEEAERPVIYRDFKMSNILLDADYNAKLSNFELAKDRPDGDKTHVSTQVIGTYGYAAPEYVMTGHLTSKSNVYSFGVVLLEMLTGRRSMDKNRPNVEHNFVEWARPHLGERRKFYRLIDPHLEGRFSSKDAKKAAQLVARCLARDPKARPLMSEVVEALTRLPNLEGMACSSS